MRRAACIGVLLVVAALGGAAPAHGAYSFVSKWGPTDPGHVGHWFPDDAAVDPSGRVWVTNPSFEQLLLLDSNGVVLRKVGGYGSGNGQFILGPVGVAADADGNIYAGDPENCRVQKFSSSGQFLAKWGSCGSGDGQFYTPSGNSGLKAIATAPNGHVYVTDEANRVQEFTASGVFVRRWSASRPKSIAVDSNNNVYTHDYEWSRIQKFDSQGALLTTWPVPNWEDLDIASGPGDALYVSVQAYSESFDVDQIRVYDTSGNQIGGWSAVSDAFRVLSGVAASDSRVYTVHNQPAFGPNRGRRAGGLQVFDLTGNFLVKWGTFGNAGDGQFRTPSSIASGAGGVLYVADTDNDRIQRFTRDGTFISKWGSTGTGPGQFMGPTEVAVAPSGDVYVVEGQTYGCCTATSNRIQRFDPVGTYIGEWQVAGAAGLATDTTGNVYVSTDVRDGQHVRKYSPTGTLLATWSADLDQPWGLDVDASGNVYVADRGHHQIKKLDSTGAVVATFGGVGSSDGLYFYSPYDVDVDAAGNMYVADTHNYRVQKVSPGGKVLAQWGSIGVENGQFDHPRGVLVDDYGDVFVADTYNDRIQKFRDDTGYPRPKSASPTYVSLVPAYDACGLPNRVHAPPLGYASCSPAAQSSSVLSAGSPDANSAPSNQTGSVRLAATGGAGPTADLALKVDITDVRCREVTPDTPPCAAANQAAGPDYAGDLRLSGLIRPTDKLNGSQGGNPGATGVDIGWGPSVPCTPSPSTGIGSTCALTTTFNTLVPGSVVGGARSNWELGQISVNDGGPDGVGQTTGDNRPYLRQGIFVP
jgi:tripartite motif-containing protein 71